MNHELFHVCCHYQIIMTTIAIIAINFVIIPIFITIMIVIIIITTFVLNKYKYHDHFSSKIILALLFCSTVLHNGIIHAIQLD